MALQNNGIKDWQNYESTKSEGEFLFIKHKTTEKYYKVHVLGTKGVFEVTSIDASPVGTMPRDYKAKEKPLYKQLDEYETPWEKELKELEQDQKNTYNPNVDTPQHFSESENLADKYEFNPVETVNEDLNKPPEISFDEEFEKELEDMKIQQQEMLKKNQKKKTGPKKEKDTKDSDKPRGWHLKKEFVDKEGNVYFKGVEQPQLKGTKKPTI